MKLISVDALEKAIYEWMPKDQETWMDSDIPPIKNLVASIMMTIQEQSPIEAIPVEWLEEKLTGHPELPYAVTDGITNVLDLWEKEDANKLL